MSNKRSLVFIGAHPDDETFGLGGTLAMYASRGVNCYYFCGTRGESGFDDPNPDLKGFASTGDLRWHELECATEILRMKGVYWLGYRDSGMPGSPDNEHPNAFCRAPVEEAAGKIVKLLRELKPQVVITHDPIGGYRHPDHIAAHNAAVMAFHAASDPDKYPEAGPAYTPQKLYYHTMPHAIMRLAVRMMPLFGRDPHKFGRNHDIDLAALVKTEFPVHALLKIPKKFELIRNEAASCHASQLGGEPPRRGILGIVNKLMGAKDHYMRAEPPWTGGRKEHDLFKGVR